MRKFILVAGIIAFAFTSCKKADMPLNPATASNSSSESGMELIKKTDPDLYNRLYNSTSKTISGPTEITVIRGIYLYTTDITRGHCAHPSPSTVCMVVIKALPVGSTSTTTTLTSNLSATYAPNTAEATVYTSPSQQIKITSLNVVFANNGEADVTMVRQ